VRRVVRSSKEQPHLDKAYELRLRTAHSGLFHGGETRFGLADFGLFQPDTTLRFQFGLSCRVRQVSRALIHPAL